MCTHTHTFTHSRAHSHTCTHVHTFAHPLHPHTCTHTVTQSHSGKASCPCCWAPGPRGRPHCCPHSASVPWAPPTRHHSRLQTSHLDGLGGQEKEPRSRWWGRREKAPADAEMPDGRLGPSVRGGVPSAQLVLASLSSGHTPAHPSTSPCLVGDGTPVPRMQPLEPEDFGSQLQPSPSLLCDPESGAAPLCARLCHGGCKGWGDSFR